MNSQLKNEFSSSESVELMVSKIDKGSLESYPKTKIDSSFNSSNLGNKPVLKRF